MNGQLTKPDISGDTTFAPGFVVRLAEGAVWQSEKCALLGGAPPRRAVFSAHGAKIVEALIAGARFVDIEEHPAAPALLRYLLDAGLVEPTAEKMPPGPISDVVIPARNRAQHVAGLINNLKVRRNVILIDDGSTDDTATAARAEGATVISLPRSGGPAAARNVGVQRSAAEIIAFIDSDCAVTPDTLDRLERQFADQAVGAVAPRVALPAGAAETLISKYEETNGSEDMGPLSGLVGPHTPIPYVPSVMLLARRSALKSIGGFSETMHVGEDVDLIWRLSAKGWRVRYVSEERVGHDHRRSLGAWLLRKFFYGLAAADLDRRHPGNLSGPSVTLSVALIVLVPTIFIPGGALVLAAALVNPQSERVGAWSLRRLAREADLILAAAIRLWLPLVMLLSAWRPINGLIILALAAWRYRVNQRSAKSRLGVPDYLAVRFLDEAFYCAGVWAGCCRWRNWRPLLPRFRSANKQSTLRNPAG